MKASIDQLKTSLEDLKLKSQPVGDKKPQDESTTVNQENADEEKEVNFERKFQKFEKDLTEEHRQLIDESRKLFETLKSDISNSIFLNVSQDVAAKTDNGTDVMKAVYSVIRSIGDGLKRTSAKQRIDGGTISRFILESAKTKLG
jgi:F0F1-type ATP synthase membrane subunit b/b'